MSGRTHNTLYDASANQAELEKKLNRYNDDLVKLRGQIDRVRAVVRGGRTDATLAVPALEESMAN